MKRGVTALKGIYTALLMIFMYAPIIAMIVLSFNASKSRAVWGGFTLHWYRSLFHDRPILSSFYNTIIIALIAAVIATIVGTLAAIGITRMRTFMRTTSMAVTNIPMLNADIVTGIAMMLLFIACRMTLGFATVLIAHITFCIPYVILSVLPKLSQARRSTYEAALDLGASPFSAYMKVVLPDILPGIVSGFMLAFTMSLDDFIITHFTKGPGVDTLSTRIYSEIRKGIRPEMYALSTLLFLIVLLLLILINNAPAPGRRATRRQLVLSRVVPACMILGVLAFTLHAARAGSAATGNGQVVVYNYGEYLDPECIDMFEKETGIEVVYEEYETNEVMYPKVASGAISYDVLCPSEYMAQRMMEEDFLTPVGMDKIKNKDNIGDRFWEKCRTFDPDNQYFVPYCWGTIGILYNKKMVDEPVDSWSILWKKKYKNSILMQNSVRDALGITLKYLGYSLNSTDMDELTEARDKLIEQKPLVQAYVVDQVRDKMIGNEAALGVIYSGEAHYSQNENPDLEYVIPKEGSNVWIDGWVIPKNARNKENAQKWIDFMCRPEIALMNFDFMTYSTPNTGVQALESDPVLRDSEILFPSDETLANCELLRYLGKDATDLYNRMWRDIKSK
ncbi:MAG: extracellular solute-binding protein [Lachnospiraceae bacterium]|nr:extracellular solute-binding protein [Lachnospiraceae bacterium]